jgi:N4-gp56 family major capsid protein
MAVTSFIPQYWSARLLTTLSKALVFGSVANRDYEGEIQDAGDTVRINNITDPTVGNYVRNSTVITPAQLDTVSQSLLIDQARFFAFYVDDVDARQAAGDLIGVATDRAGYKLADTADQFLNTTAVAGAGSRTGGLTITTGEHVWAQLLASKVVLDTNNVPSEGRWAVITPAFHALLMDTPKFLDASQSGSTEPLLNGRVGRAAGFDIRVSNNASANTIVTGHPMAMTYAEQIVKVEAYRPQSAFSDAVKGLHVSGARVVRPEALVMRRVAAL